MQAHFFRLSLIFLLTLLSASATLPTAAAGDPLVVYTSIVPQEYFIEQIGGERVQVQALVQPGHSPATYGATPRQMAELAKARVYFRIGVPFENSLMPKLARSLPYLEIMDLRDGIDMMPLTHSHAEHDEREGDLDPHTWLDPTLALHQAKIIRNTLIRLDPDGGKLYRTNFDRLAAELKELDKTLSTMLTPLAGRLMYVFHPAYGYFCRRYDLSQKAVNPDGKEPGAHYLARLIEKARRDKVRAIFVQAQFSRKAARTIARSIGADLVVLDPLARDYPANMLHIAEQLLTAIPETKK